ncbi:acetate/propionate family kinase [Altererythrobacter sp. Root672]|uniref:acetate/propionate family kinase n=1 Tax=Altererythrobacter sp. Root672 TaxID=1736584 RepID=UPI0006FD7900|nr:acetate/propionate family kinase [Altererythrobacter sp. Root672]KRA83349.1 acetate kinase [Altererythrobacter sp. Root672]
MSEPIAVINAGSSSIKFAVYADGGADELLFRGQVEKLGTAPRLRVTDAGGEALLDRDWAPGEIDHREAVNVILHSSLDLLGGRKVAGVGHRVVHGGTRYSEPVRVDPSVLGELRALSPLAPLHQPHNLAAIEAIATAAPDMPQVACFDTAFHHTQPELAQLYALPKELTDEGIRRYGFHGLSYEHVTGRLREVAPWLANGRAIIAHLGNGSSLCAIRKGESVATTMGFTAVEGLMMGTRCGSIDPGVLIYLMDQHGMDARALEELVYKKSGLLGVSGVSSDMRELKASTEPRASLAIDLFIYRIAREIGSLVAALGGLDGLIFAGGIGENDDDLRLRVAKRCSWLGVDIVQSGGVGERRLSRSDAAVDVWVIPTDEERMIARHTREVLSG